MFFYNSQTRFNETITFFFEYCYSTNGKDRYLFFNIYPALAVLPCKTTIINNSVINTKLFDVQQKLLLLVFSSTFTLHQIPRKMMSAFEINVINQSSFIIYCPNWFIIYSRKNVYPYGHTYVWFITLFYESNVCMTDEQMIIFYWEYFCFFSLK